MIKTEDKTPIVHNKIINKINKKNKNKLKKNTAKTHISNFKNEKIKLMRVRHSII